MAQVISASVGAGKANHKSDVKTIQALLNRNLVFIKPHQPLIEDGKFGPATAQALKTYQSRVIHMPNPDAVVSPSGPTLRSLVGHVAPLNSGIKPKQPPAGGVAEAEFVEAARLLGCEVAAIKAVAQTETHRSAFDGNGRPAILFERHKFHEFTSGKHDKAAPDLSNKTAGGYGKFSEQYGKLERAMKLDKEAALKSTSWGAFQIMGFNHRAAGYPTVDAFVDAMKQSESNHLRAFVSFIKSDEVLLTSLQKKDWQTFARRYNGPKFSENNYDTKMKNNYEEIRGDDEKMRDQPSIQMP